MDLSIHFPEALRGRSALRQPLRCTVGSGDNRVMDSPDDERSRSAAFLALLIEDVIAARKRLTTAHTQTARRDVVRASLAAIEGMIWVAREHVRTVLASLEQLTPVADLAMQELTYTVSERGRPSHCRLCDGQRKPSLRSIQ
jgi:hypothetical protein